MLEEFLGKISPLFKKTTQPVTHIGLQSLSRSLQAHTLTCRCAIAFLLKQYCNFSLVDDKTSTNKMFSHALVTPTKCCAVENNVDQKKSVFIEIFEMYPHSCILPSAEYGGEFQLN